MSTPLNDPTPDPELVHRYEPASTEPELVQKDGADPSKVSPKVIAGFAATLALAALAAFLSAITPEMLSDLGQFAIPAALGIAALAQGITGYLKSDPARTGYVPKHSADR